MTSDPQKPAARKMASVVLRSRGTEGAYNTDSAEVGAGGALVLEARDVGAHTEELWGSDEHTFIVTVAADWKDTVLLKLLRDRFQTVSAASAWLKDGGIPFTASRWT